MGKSIKSKIYSQDVTNGYYRVYFPETGQQAEFTKNQLKVAIKRAEKHGLLNKDKQSQSWWSKVWSSLF